MIFLISKISELLWSSLDVEADQCFCRASLEPVATSASFVLSAPLQEGRDVIGRRDVAIYNPVSVIVKDLTEAVSGAVVFPPP